MPVPLSRLDKDLGVRIPADLAKAAGFREGDLVDIRFDRARLTITPAQSSPTLAELLQGSEGLDWSAAFDWGPDIGREQVRD